MKPPLAIVLAAGKGTRMNSERPKVLNEVLGRPMIEFVLDALAAAGIERAIVVVGYRAADVKAALADRPALEFVEQTEQLGTGHAVKVCREKLADHDGAVLIVTGDSPLVQVDSLRDLLDEFRRSRPACILGTLHKPQPAGLGRILRDAEGKFLGIVEERDSSDEQRRITEVNMSTYVFDAARLRWVLEQLRNDNRQREYYITDAPGILMARGEDVQALPVLRPCEALSINTPDELRAVEAEMRKLGY